MPRGRQRLGWPLFLAVAGSAAACVYSPLKLAPLPMADSEDLTGTDGAGPPSDARPGGDGPAADGGGDRGAGDYRGGDFFMADPDNPCEGVTCSNHGGCMNNAGQAYCFCMAGQYHSVTPADCVADSLCPPNAITDCRASDGNVWRFDYCMNPMSVAAVCNGMGCTGGFCHGSGDPWFGVQGSELAPRTTLLDGGSAAGGGLSHHSGASASPAVVQTSAGDVLVAWSNASASGSHVYIRKWTQATSSWSGVPEGSTTGFGISGASTTATAPAIALVGGAPVVAWQDAVSGPTRIYLKQWTGSTWIELAGSATGGGVSNSAEYGAQVALATDSNNNIYVVWTELISGNHEIYLKRWNGTGWEALAGSAAGGGISSSPTQSSQSSIAVSSNGVVAVAWTEGTLGEIWLRTWNDTFNTWNEYPTGSATDGGISNTTAAGSAGPKVAIDTSDRIVVAWQETGVSGPSVHLRRWDSSSAWAELGGSATGTGVSATTGKASVPTLTLLGGNQILVAWQHDTTTNPEIYAKAWNGTAWAELPMTGTSATGGGISSNAGSSTAPALGAPSSVGPVVVWADDSSGNTEIYARRMTSGWMALGNENFTGGGVSGNAGLSETPVLKVAGDQLPRLAWADSTAGNFEVFYSALSTGGWAGLGGSALGGGISSNAGASRQPALAFDLGNSPTLAWTDTTYGGTDLAQIYLKQWNGTAWAEVKGSATTGGVSSNGSACTEPSLVRPLGGDPVVAYTVALAPDEIYLRTPGAADWGPFSMGSDTGSGFSNSPGDSSTGPVMVVDASGNPALAWTEAPDGSQPFIRLARWNGATWVLATPISNPGVPSTEPALAIDKNDDIIVVWTLGASTGPSQICALKLAGVTSTGLGPCSPSAGLSGTAGRSVAPSVSLDVANRPVVAWQDDTSGNDEIYVRRWDGSGWQEYSGSATGGGISNSSGRSARPSVAVTALGVCVAWEEAGRSSTEIVLRCADWP